MTMHIGATATSGHYEAVVCHDGTWLRCSDENVTVITANEALSPSSAIYMCVYTGTMLHCFVKIGITLWITDITVNTIKIP